jgi:hypothetical protein
LLARLFVIAVLLLLVSAALRLAGSTTGPDSALAIAGPLGVLALALFLLVFVAALVRG